MDRQRLSYEYMQRQAIAQSISPAGTALYGLLVIYIAYQAFAYFDYPILPPQELLWNAIVYLLPTHLLLDSARRQELKANNMLSQTHAVKSDALRRMLGMGGNAVVQNMPATGMMTRTSTTLFSRPRVTSDMPPGLGNWDNSCYQNSVLQGLASLDSLKPYLEQTTDASGGSDTSDSLLETIGKLKNAENNGKQLWTPATLKSMSSWQQQDAQEYFSKIMDELDKEAAKATAGASANSGLEGLVEARSADQREPSSAQNQAARNPMEGLLAQKVACTRCGFTEGLSLIPFNCLTVPLGPDFAYDLDECLDEYTKLEEISDVECAKCTLLRAEKQLNAMLPSPPENGHVEEKPEVDSKILSLPPELRAQAFKRLAAIQTALEEDDFEDKTIAEKCEIGKKARVSSTKTRQAAIARAPQNLVVHVNRSVFDEMTCAQRKNYASVRWQGELDLGSWMLRSGGREGGGGVSLLGERDEQVARAKYRIKAVVTHYGRHENGHYICYRRHPIRWREEAVDEEDVVSTYELESQGEPSKPLEERWWRLSDEDVSSVSEDEVLAQGGVFMLFYERIDDAVELVEKPPINVAAAEPMGQATDVSTEATSDQHIEVAALESQLGPSTADADEPKVEPSIVPTMQAETMDAATSSEEAATPGESFENNREADPAVLPTEDTAQTARKSPTPPFMRTARGKQASKSENGFGGMGMRAMAAT